MEKKEQTLNATCNVCRLNFDSVVKVMNSIYRWYERTKWQHYIHINNYPQIYELMKREN